MMSSMIELTKKRLFAQKRNEKVKRRSLLAAGVVESETNGNALETILRIRPHKNAFPDFLQLDSATHLTIKHPTRPGHGEQYGFNEVVPLTTTQREMFGHTGSKMIKSALEGQNCCLFTYGASGSGKTFTMMGGPGEDAGVLPRTMETLFAALSDRLYDSTDIRPTGSGYISRVGINEEKQSNLFKEELLGRIDDDQCSSGDWNTRRRSSILRLHPEFLKPGSGPATTIEDFADDTDYIVFASFVEIYNEKIHDLLVPVEGTRRSELRIRQDAKGPFVGGVHQIQINSAQEAYKVIDAGRRNLNVASTHLNNLSSRSHCLFVVKIAKRLSLHRWGVSQICFCDLAGAERSKKIGTDEKRLGESKTINKSLMQLGIVIEELRNNQRNPGSVAVSFRNSKLTRLMQSYLTGNSKTTIIVTISQDEKMAEETLHSLKFAASAKTVSLGLDRHGRKDTSKMNVSTLHDMTNASVMFKTMSGTMIDNYHQNDSVFYQRQPSSIPEDMIVSSSTTTTTTTSMGSSVFECEDFRKWTKADLIDDLVYYKDRERELASSVIAMKDAWKEDEQLMKEEREDFDLQKKTWREDFDLQKKNWKIDNFNSRAKLQNHFNDEVEKLFEKIKLGREQLKEAQENFDQLKNEDEKRLATAIAEEKEHWKDDRNLLEMKLKQVETELEQMTLSKDDIDTNNKLIEMQKVNLESALAEQTKLADNNQKMVMQLRASLTQLEKKMAEKEDELMVAKTRLSIDPLESNDTIDFDNFPAPKLRSSMLPQTPNMNSTQELLSNIAEDMSRTPDLIQPLSGNPEPVPQDNKIDLYRQIQDLNGKLREAQRELQRVKSEDQENDQKRLEAFKHQVKVAADHEVDQDQKIKALELEIGVLKRRCDRCLIRKQKESLEKDNENLKDQVHKLEILLASGTPNQSEELTPPNSTPTKKFKDHVENLDPVISELEKGKPRTRSQRPFDPSNQALTSAPRRNLRSRK